MEQFLAVKKNVEYKQVLQQSDNIVMALSNHVKEMGDIESAESLELIKKSYTEKILPQYCNMEAKDSVFLQMLILFLFFLKENQVGASVYTLYAEEEKRPIDRYGDLPESVLDPISNKNEKLQKVLLEKLSINGEIFFERTQFLIVFYLIGVTIDIFEQVTQENTQPEDSFVVNLWRARHANIYEENLMSVAENLESEILDSYKTSVQLMRDRLAYLEDSKLEEEAQAVRRNLSMLLSEYAHPLI